MNERIENTCIYAKNIYIPHAIALFSLEMNNMSDLKVTLQAFRLDGKKVESSIPPGVASCAPDPADQCPYGLSAGP